MFTDMVVVIANGEGILVLFLIGANGQADVSALR